MQENIRQDHTTIHLKLLAIAALVSLGIGLYFIISSSIELLHFAQQHPQIYSANDTDIRFVSSEQKTYILILRDQYKLFDHIQYNLIYQSIILLAIIVSYRPASCGSILSGLIFVLSALFYSFRQIEHFHLINNAYTNYLLSYSQNSSDLALIEQFRQIQQTHHNNLIGSLLLNLTMLFCWYHMHYSTPDQSTQAASPAAAQSTLDPIPQASIINRPILGVALSTIVLYCIAYFGLWSTYQSLLAQSAPINPTITTWIETITQYPQARLSLTVFALFISINIFSLKSQTPHTLSIGTIIFGIAFFVLGVLSHFSQLYQSVSTAYSGLHNQLAQPGTFETNIQAAAQTYIQQQAIINLLISIILISFTYQQIKFILHGEKLEPIKQSIHKLRNKFSQPNTQ